MVGGILELVARSVEDVFIIGNPQITLFKVVYRRYTNFSREEKKLKFNNKVDFDTKCTCRIKRFGDLVHKLHLVIDIPGIDIRYKILKISTIKSMLEAYGIIWTLDDGDALTSPITDDHMDQIEELINAKIIELETLRDEIDNLDNEEDILGALEQIFTDSEITDNEFFYAAISSIMTYYSGSVVYKFIESYKNDAIAEEDNSIITISDLKNELYLRYRNIIYDSVENFYRESSYTDENILFINVLERGKFSISTIDLGIDSSTFFKNKINELYTNNINLDENTYTVHDSYKIFDQYLTNKNVIINNIYEPAVIKTNIQDHVLYDIGKNIQFLLKIYNNLGLAYRFMFYKRYSYDSPSDSYDTSENFVNISTSNISKFNDNFTNNFTIEKIEGEPDGITHFYSDYVIPTITTFHTSNRALYRKSTFTDYYANKELWSAIDIKTLLTVDDDYSDALENVKLLNLIPLVAITDIYSSINSVLTNIMEITSSVDDPHIIGIKNITIDKIDPIKTMLLSEIIASDLVSDADISQLAELSDTYKKSTDDIILTGLFTPYKYFSYAGSSYNVMEYLKRIYMGNLLDAILDYSSLYEQKLLNSNMSYCTVSFTTYGTSSVETVLNINFPTGSTFSTTVGNYFNIYSANDEIKYKVWFNVDSGSTEPILEGTTSIEIAIESDNTSTQVASSVATALNALDTFSATNSDETVTVTNSSSGYSSQTSCANMPHKLAAEELVIGTSSAKRSIKITTKSASEYTSTGTSNYLSLYGELNTNKYYIWFSNGGDDPELSDYTNSYSIDITNITTADEVATALSECINYNIGTVFTSTVDGSEVTITNDTFGISGPMDIGTENDPNHLGIIDSINMFFMVTDSDASSVFILPNYSKYEANGLSLYQINRSHITFKNPLVSSSNTSEVIDVQSSIWYDIYTNIIDSYNNLYDKIILSNEYFTESLGSEMLRYKTHIDTNENDETGNIFTNIREDDGLGGYSINYYLATSTMTDKIINSTTGWLNNELDLYNQVIDAYDANKGILNIYDNTIPLTTHTFETFDNMHKIFEDILYSDFETNKDVISSIKTYMRI